MNLLALKEHMTHVRVASLAGLCAIFNTEPDNVRCMLSHWIRKGKIRKCLKQPDCGSKCNKCPAAVTELYEWVYN